MGGELAQLPQKEASLQLKKQKPQPQRQEQRRRTEHWKQINRSMSNLVKKQAKIQMVPPEQKTGNLNQKKEAKEPQKDQKKKEVVAVQKEDELQSLKQSLQSLIDAARQAQRREEPQRRPDRSQLNSQIEPVQQAAGRTAMATVNLMKRRILNEFRDIQKNRPANWSVDIDGNCWHVTIVVTNCPYHTLPFVLEITFPQDYPQGIPEFKLAKPQLFFHPNIYDSGNICAKYLQRKDKCLMVRERIEGFIHLLSNPNPDNPANNEAAKLFNSDPRAYSRKAYRIYRGEQHKKIRTHKDLFEEMIMRQMGRRENDGNAFLAMGIVAALHHLSNRNE